MRIRPLALALLAALGGCGRGTETEAKAAVHEYLAKMILAYRAGDEQVVDPLVTERLGRKLTGLIGVKSDVDLVLDAKLLELEFVAVRREGEVVVVDTRERWHYRDLHARTGAQMGEDSTDEYAMRYRLVREGGRWKVDETAFRETPKVGRQTAPLAIDAKKAHGLAPAPVPPPAGGGEGSAGRGADPVAPVPGSPGR